MRRLASAASRPRDSVVLPAPEGEESTSSSPRRAIAGAPGPPARGWGVSLNVLHLLAHLVDHRLELQARPRGLGIGRLGAQRIGLAVELLGQEVEAAARRLARDD